MAQGKDPVEERRRQQQAQQVKDAQTFGVLAADYIQRHAIPKKRESSVVEDRRIIDTYLLPAWRDTPSASRRPTWLPCSIRSPSSERLR